MSKHLEDSIAAVESHTARLRERAIERPEEAERIALALHRASELLYYFELELTRPEPRPPGFGGATHGEAS
jgi:hypothetical protein